MLFSQLMQRLSLLMMQGLVAAKVKKTASFIVNCLDAITTMLLMLTVPNTSMKN